MYIAKIKKKKLPILIVFSAVILTSILSIDLMIRSPIVSAQELSFGSYVYVLDSSGVAHVTLVVRNVEGIYEVYLRIEPGTIRSSLTAFDSAGNLLPASFLNDTLVMIYTANSTDTVVVTYSAVVGSNVGGVIQITITPHGNATVKLPKGAALLYFDDDPVIEIVENSITLYYTIGGIHNLTYIAPPPEITTTTSPPETTTTTPPQTTTTQPTTSTAPPTTITTTIPPSETSTTTTTPQQTATPPPGTSTTTTQQTTTTSLPTTTTPVIQPQTTTHESRTTTSTTTEAQPAEGGIPMPALALVAIAVVAIALLLLIKGRKGGSGEGVSSSSATPPPPPEPSIPEHTELPPTDLDERDITLMRVIGEIGETTISELAKRTGLSKSVVWRRVRKLTDLGMISKEDVGAKSILRLTDKGKEVIGGSA